MNELSPEFIEKIYFEIGRNARESLRSLCNVAKKKLPGEQITNLEKQHGLILNSLKSDDAKTRKNAAILLGALCYPAQDELIFATDNETTEFVLPSLILALGKIDLPKSREFLKNYKPKSQVEKHLIEEKNALKLALGSFLEVSPAIPDIKNKNLALFTMRGHADLCAEELDDHEIDYSSHKQIQDCLVVKLTDIKELNKIRTYTHAFIILGKCEKIKLLSFFSNTKFMQGLDEIFKRKENETLNYRVDIEGDKQKDKKEFLKIITGAIDEKKYSNNPNAYSFEITVFIKDAFAHCMIKISDLLDKRFSYRKNTLSASINPVTAANIMRYCYPYLRRDAVVCDAFCGTATMLIERSYIKECSALIGVDFSKDAAVFARENCAIAKVNAKIIRADVTRIEKKAGFDEVISNMPFGHRVSSSVNNKQLYERFALKLLEILKENGRAFLYTNDKVTFRESIKKTGGFTMIDEVIFASGNIHASLFILEKD